MTAAGQRYGSGGVIVLVGLLSLVVPVYDAWEDVAIQGDQPITTFVENAPLLVLGGAVIASGVWLARSDLEGRYARTVARLTVWNVAGVAALITLVVGIQFQVQNELKPVIIAADAVIIGAVGGVVIGVRTAQQERAFDDAERQRARAEALFDNHTDAVAFVQAVDGGLAVADVNDQFSATFGYGADELDDLRALSPDDVADDDIATETVVRDRVRDEVTRETDDGQREFIRQTVPVETGVGGTREAYVVYTDIGDQKERERQLEFLNSLLRHDIQNGMTVIRSRAEHLAETLEGRQAEFAATIEDRSDDLAGLTDRFRLMLDALTGDVDEERTARPLAPVVDDQVEALRMSYPEASVTTDVPGDLEVYADDLLENVVWNLLSNAVEHNDRADPEVRVRAAPAGDEVRLEVADNGPGVPDELKDAVFRRQESGVRNDVGSGFGLFFIDRMVTHYGGTVRVEDNDPEGAVFVLRLPSP